MMKKRTKRYLTFVIQGERASGASWLAEAAVLAYEKSGVLVQLYDGGGLHAKQEQIARRIRIFFTHDLATAVVAVVPEEYITDIIERLADLTLEVRVVKLSKLT